MEVSGLEIPPFKFNFKVIMLPFDWLESLGTSWLEVMSRRVEAHPGPAGHPRNTCMPKTWKLVWQIQKLQLHALRACELLPQALANRDL
jgi:hypothetical protein